MRQRTLGDGLACSAIGLGCMGLSQGYGPADDEESTALIRRALDLGVTLIDTAQSYGRGHNETLIGGAIRGGRRRDAGEGVRRWRWSASTGTPDRYSEGELEFGTARSLAQL